MRKILFAALFVSGLSAPALAEPDPRPAVLAAVDRFLDAINTDDPVKLAASQLPQGMTFRLGYEPDGTMKLRARSNAEWVAISGSGKQRFHERYWAPKVMIHRDMAVVWAPYSFDIDGKRSHCGIDVFDVIRIDGQWKIANAMWTVEPQGCKGH
ncbi:MAG: hypothetical protein ACKOPG_07260 [Novosphingobium sp.]